MKSVKLQLKNQNLETKAYEYAMFLLNIRLRTEGELREKLRMKNYELGITDEVIKRLKESRYVDDLRFAQVYVENLKKYKYWGYYGIQKKLMEKKLPMSVIDRVLGENLSEQEEMEIAKRFIKKYELGMMNNAEKQKIAKKLAAKGFRSSVVTKLVF